MAVCTDAFPPHIALTTDPTKMGNAWMVVSLKNSNTENDADDHKEYDDVGGGDDVRNDADEIKEFCDS